MERSDDCCLFDVFAFIVVLVTVTFISCPQGIAQKFFILLCPSAMSVRSSNAIVIFLFTKMSSSVVQGNLVTRM